MRCRGSGDACCSNSFRSRHVSGARPPVPAHFPERSGNSCSCQISLNGSNQTSRALHTDRPYIIPVKNHSFIPRDISFGRQTETRNDPPLPPQKRMTASNEPLYSVGWFDGRDSDPPFHLPVVRFNTIRARAPTSGAEMFPPRGRKGERRTSLKCFRPPILTPFGMRTPTLPYSLSGHHAGSQTTSASRHLQYKHNALDGRRQEFLFSTKSIRRNTDSCGPYLDLEDSLHPEVVRLLLPLGKKLLLERRIRRVLIGQDAQLETVYAGSSHERSVHLGVRIGALRKEQGKHQSARERERLYLRCNELNMPPGVRCWPHWVKEQDKYASAAQQAVAAGYRQDTTLRVNSHWVSWLGTQ